MNAKVLIKFLRALIESIPGKGISDTGQPASASYQEGEPLVI